MASLASNKGGGKKGHGKKPKAVHGKNLSSAQINSLGQSSTVQAIRSSVSASTWKKIQARAKQQGYTVEGLLNSVPGPMKEHSRAYITKTATTTINKAYAPASTALNQQEKRVQNVDLKRKNDNQHYLDWLATQSTKLTTDAKAADALMADKERALVQTTADGYSQLHQQAAADAAAQPGTVSDFSQAHALDFSNQGSRAVGTLAAGAESGLHQTEAHQQHAATLEANNYAISAANDARRQADTWKALSDIGDERQKLKLSQAADTAKEVARLLDQEITKAGSNRDAQLAGAKLQIQSDTLKSKNAQFAQTFGLAQSKFALDQAKFAHQIKVDGVKLNQTDQQIALTTDRNQLGWYRARHPGGNKGAKGTNNQANYDKAYATLSIATFKKGKKTRPLTVGYVRAHEGAVLAGLVAAGYSRKVAKAAVRAWLSNNGTGADPGHYSGRTAPQTSSNNNTHGN
jgi:hypothetical protein